MLILFLYYSLLPLFSPNSPDCCKQYTLEEALELLPRRASELELTDGNIKAGKNISVTHDLQPGEVVEWFWTLEDKADVDFSVVLQPTGADAKPIQIVQASRIEGCGIPAQGSYQTAVEGTVTIMWDNNFSYFSSKNIKYWSQKTDKRPVASIAAAKARAAAAK